MRGQRLLAIAISTWLWCTCSVVFAERYKIGEAGWSVHAAVQYWVTVSDQREEHRVIVRGFIEKIEKQRLDPPWADGDWNIHVRPADGYEGLLINSQNEKNADGLIELEIKSPAPLDQLFKVGELIEAYGWFVEDYGHSSATTKVPAGESGSTAAAVIGAAASSLMFGDPTVGAAVGVAATNEATHSGAKTELHPVIYIKKGNVTDSSFLLFAAQDRSGRFLPANQPLEHYFTGWVVPVSHNPTSYIWSPVGSIPAPSRADILEEQVQLDCGFRAHVNAQIAAM